MNKILKHLEKAEANSEILKELINEEMAELCYDSSVEKPGRRPEEKNKTIEENEKTIEEMVRLIKNSLQKSVNNN